MKCVRPDGPCSLGSDAKVCRLCCYYEPDMPGEVTRQFREDFVRSVLKQVENKTFFGHPMFYQILDELKDLHSRKNQDYAGEDPLSNLKMCEKAGLPAWKGVIVRLTDKISRLLTFAKKEEFRVKDESVEDTFRDTAIYAILGLILYRESKNASKN